MKILLINPNSDPAMTAVIQRAADNFARGEFAVLCKPTPGAPAFIDSYLDEVAAAPGMLRLLAEHAADYDGVVVACQDDPNLDAMKQATARPVVGIAEASMKIASMLGHRFSIVSTSRSSIPNHEALARKYLLQDALASVRAPGNELAGYSDEEKYLRVARQAIEEDLAEVIVLGCAGLADLAPRMQAQLGVPVLDGVACGLTIIVGLVKSGLTTSKIGRYRARGGEC